MVGSAEYSALTNGEGGAAALAAGSGSTGSLAIGIGVGIGITVIAVALVTARRYKRIRNRLPKRMSPMEASVTIALPDVDEAPEEFGLSEQEIVSTTAKSEAAQLASEEDGLSEQEVVSATAKSEVVQLSVVDQPPEPVASTMVQPPDAFKTFSAEPLVQVPGVVRPSLPSHQRRYGPPSPGASCKLGDRSLGALSASRGPACSWVTGAVESCIRNEGQSSPSSPTLGAGATCEASGNQSDASDSDSDAQRGEGQLERSQSITNNGTIDRARSFEYRV